MYKVIDVKLIKINITINDKIKKSVINKSEAYIILFTNSGASLIIFLIKKFKLFFLKKRIFFLRIFSK